MKPASGAGPESFSFPSSVQGWSRGAAEAWGRAGGPAFVPLSLFARLSSAESAQPILSFTAFLCS